MCVTHDTNNAFTYLYGHNAVYKECHRSIKFHRKRSNSETQWPTSNTNGQELTNGWGLMALPTQFRSYRTFNVELYYKYKNVSNRY